MLGKLSGWLVVLIIFSSILDQVELRNIGKVPKSEQAAQCGYQVSDSMYVHICISAYICMYIHMCIYLKQLCTYIDSVYKYI